MKLMLGLNVYVEIENEVDLEVDVEVEVEAELKVVSALFEVTKVDRLRKLGMKKVFMYTISTFNQLHLFTGSENTSQR